MIFRWTGKLLETPSRDREVLIIHVTDKELMSIQQRPKTPTTQEGKATAQLITAERLAGTLHKDPRKESGEETTVRRPAHAPSAQIEQDEAHRWPGWGTAGPLSPAVA